MLYANKLLYKIKYNLLNKIFCSRNVPIRIMPC